MFQYDIIDRIPELLSFVYMSFIHYFCQCLFFKAPMGPASPAGGV